MISDREQVIPREIIRFTRDDTLKCLFGNSDTATYLSSLHRGFRGQISFA